METKYFKEVYKSLAEITDPEQRISVIAQMSQNQQLTEQYAGLTFEQYFTGIETLKEKHEFDFVVELGSGKNFSFIKDIKVEPKTIDSSTGWSWMFESFEVCFSYESDTSGDRIDVMGLYEDITLVPEQEEALVVITEQANDLYKDIKTVFDDYHQALSFGEDSAFFTYVEQVILDNDVVFMMERVEVTHEHDNSESSDE